MKLTPKQAAFVREYLVDLNGTQAAIRAGYSEKTAKQIASQLMDKPEVAEAISAAQAERSDRLAISVDGIEQELAKIGWFNIKDHVSIITAADPHAAILALPDSVTAAIAGITVDTYMDGRGEDAREVRRVTLKFFDKRAALVDLGRRHGMFVDRHEIVDKTPLPDRTKLDRAKAVIQVIAAAGIEARTRGHLAKLKSMALLMRRLSDEWLEDVNWNTPKEKHNVE